MSASIIFALDALYRCRVLFRIFDSINVSDKTIYNIDVLTTMRWLRNEWNNLKADTVVSSWKIFFQLLIKTLSTLR